VVDPRVVDVALAAVVAVPTTMDAWWNEPGTRQADVLTYAFAAVSVVALLARRRWPRAVAVICGAALTGWYVRGHHGEMLNLPTMVALYTVAAHGDRHRTIVTGAVAAAWAGVVSAGFGDDPSGAPVAEMAWPLLALLLGENVRGRRELLAEYAARAEQAEADREREARRRAQEERLTIARELHDVVAHTLAGVNVQMGVAATAFDSHPDAARRALAQARASAREALGELRATVAVLRDPSGGGSTAPAPTLADLDGLVEQARRSGLDVDVTVRTGDRDLPAVVGLAAYRIVQEALTNVIRHAGARRASVTVAVPAGSAGALVVTVEDDGRGPPAAALDDPGRAPGFGLVGMAERAAALGGRVEHGPAPGGGFRVRAELPLEPVPEDGALPTGSGAGTPGGAA
jgi:signal transduction histidine kinase